ncbi:MAG: hypothetical protein AAGI49_07065 [Bacteroidota bacterium]
MNIEQLTWLDLFLEAVVLIGVYFLLRFLDQRLSNTLNTSSFVITIKRVVHSVLLIYEPIVVVLVGSTFVLINPLLHGVIMGGLLIVGFPYLRHYLSGRLMQFDNRISIGKQIKLEDVKGVIAQIGRTGIYLQTSDGSHYTNYTELYKKGYTLTDQEEVGGFYQLKIKRPNEKGNATDLLDLMATLPYLDWNHRPKIRTDAQSSQQYNVQISVKEERHLHELIRALAERKYECEVVG